MFEFINRKIRYKEDDSMSVKSESADNIKTEDASTDINEENTVKLISEDIIKMGYSKNSFTISDNVNLINDTKLNMCENNVVEQNNGCDCRDNSLEYYPSKNGLYPDEILMLFMASGYKSVDNYFPRYWEYKYAVKNPQSMLQSLEDRGFIVKGGLKETLSKLTVNVLKEELIIHNLKVSGKKDDLINRLIDGVDNTLLGDKFRNRPYALTNLGEEELKENEYVLYLHRNTIYNVGIWKMNHLLYFDNPKKLGYRDILWREINLRALYYYGKGEFGMYRGTHLCKYKLVMEEGKYRAAFSSLIEMLYFDLSGLDNSWNYYKDNRCDYLQRVIESSFPYIGENNSRCITSLVPEAVEGWLSDMKEKLEIKSDQEYYKILLEKFIDVEKYYPYHIFTPEECAHICIWEMNKDIDKIIEVYHQAELRVRKEFESIIDN